jgi:biopolymer transport protein TolR
MAMKAQQKEGAMADINVTPFIDVCLVLLIIFMITVAVTMLQLGYFSRFPNDGIGQPTGQILIRVIGSCEMGQLSSCQVYMNKELIPLNKLIEKMRPIASKIPSTQPVFFTADDNVNYENAMKILDMVYTAGAHNIGMLTEPFAVEQ